ncbi:MAG TPA: dipicolinate synthase subunit B [Bacillota bacterium]|nr:dipicolinate synthase subunit B [Bacillota bacterium]
MTSLKNKKIGLAMTGSHCTLSNILPQVEKLKEAGAELFPIFSETVQSVDTRFGPASQWQNRMAAISGKQPWQTIVEVEPIGPQKLLDLLLIAPCTGNTMAKLAGGIVDAVVLMAAKAQLRNQKPVLLFVSTNDGLGLNAKNLALLMNTKHIYLVPFGQDDPQEKPNSLVSNPDLILPAAAAALQGRQLQPVIICYKK